MIEDSKKKLGWAIRELNMSYRPVSLEQRAENAYGVTVKVFDLIITYCNDEEEAKKLMAALFKSIRDKDFRKFKKAFRKHESIKNH